MSRPATLPRAARAQVAMELRLTARRGENLLAIAVIPAVILVFFSSTSVLGRSPGVVDALLPGTLALAVVAAGLVNLGIATAYERTYGALKRLGGSPLGRDGLVAAKIAAVGVVVAFQTVLLLGVAAVALGWRPGPDWSPPLALLGLTLGTLTFAGLGLLLAGTLRAEATLALANVLFLTALLFGGVLLPVAELPPPLAAIAGWTPFAALTDVMDTALGGGADIAGPLAVLIAWGIGAAVLAARWFRWE